MTTSEYWGPRVRRIAQTLFARYAYTSFATLLLVVLLIVNVTMDPSLLTSAGALETWSTVAPLALLAIALTPSVLSGHGGIDLSLGPFAGLCTVLIGTYLNSGTLGEPYVVVPLILLLGLLLGAVNGLVITTARVQPIVVTLGSYLAVTGLTDHLSPGSGGTVPTWVTSISGSDVDVAIALVVIVAWMLMTRTQFFNWLLAVGQDDRTAYASGVPVTAVRTTAYIIGGLIAGVAGLVMTALISGASSTVGPTYTLTSIAAVAVGGTSLAGGRGGILGSIVGALDIFLIENVLTLINIPVFAENVAYGGILVLAVTINSLMGRSRWASSRVRLPVEASGRQAKLKRSVSL